MGEGNIAIDFDADTESSNIEQSNAHAEDQSMHQGATKLQANFRGFKDRKAVGEKKAMIASFDPSNDAMQEGAAKLQASFRGFKDRKRMNEIRGGQDNSEVEGDMITKQDEEQREQHTQGK